jgi:dTDP-glucose 4,6-dehydratase
MQKKAIVTGGLGFIGSNLINLLLKKNFFVINIDKMNYASNVYNLKNIKRKNNYKFYKSDICNKKMLSMILKKYKPNVLFNLAAETHVDRSINNPQNFVRSNILGVYNILECIKKYIKIRKNFRMIHVSTDEVYGDIWGSKKSKEGDKYQPSSPYSASKASADHLINAYVKTYGLPIIISNCCNNFGPNQFPEKFVPKTIFNIIKKKNIPIYGKGKNQREWIYVEDHSRALIKLFKKGKIGESYNIGTGFIINNLKLSQKIIKIYKSNFDKKKQKIKIEFVKDRPGHDFKYALDSSKIRKKLCWKHLYNFNEALNKTIEWYLKNPKFYSIKQRRKFDKRLGLIND